MQHTHGGESKLAIQLIPPEFQQNIKFKYIDDSLATVLIGSILSPSPNLGILVAAAE